MDWEAPGGPATQTVGPCSRPRASKAGVSGAVATARLVGPHFGSSGSAISIGFQNADLLEFIFNFLLPSGHGRRDLRTLSPLSAVCRKWREVSQYGRWWASIASVFPPEWKVRRTRLLVNRRHFHSCRQDIRLSPSTTVHLYSSGYRCIGTSRVLADRSVHTRIAGSGRASVRGSRPVERAVPGAAAGAGAAGVERGGLGQGPVDQLRAGGPAGLAHAALRHGAPGGVEAGGAELGHPPVLRRRPRGTRLLCRRAWPRRAVPVAGHARRLLRAGPVGPTCERFRTCRNAL